LRLSGNLQATILSVILLLPWPAGAEAPRLAVFDFEPIDTSLEGEMSGARSDEQQRLAMISDQLPRLLIDRGGYTIIDLAPATDAIAKSGPLDRCNGCAAAIARPLGARFALTGTVQKVSNLILNINVSVWDTETGKERYRTSVDIRGNTDESWSRGVSYLVRNRLLAALAEIAATP
jgi:hypothetical protein